MSGSTTVADRSPVIVGVGQFLNRGTDPIEPSGLMVEAVELALADTGTVIDPLRIDAIAAVPTFTWRYRDPGRLVADAIGAERASTWYATVGGNTPQMLMNRLGREIQAGAIGVGILCGGEAGHSRQRLKREDTRPEWTIQGDEVDPDWHDGGEFMLGDQAEIDRGIVMPAQVYPLFENALWHRSGRTRSEHVDHIGRLWARFSEVAAENPYAWQPQAYTAEEIITPTPENRYIGAPYTKHMVANPMVDMSAAVVVCSAGIARELGIAEDRWVYLHSGTDGIDHKLSRRVDFTSSPAIRIAGRRALELADVTPAEIDHLDVYSCFPSAVQIAVQELDLDEDADLTVYGGLPFAGGPWNNPVTHAIASMVDVLRGDPGSVGLVTANGGSIDKHAFGVYSTAPPPEGYRHDSPQAEIDAFSAVEVLADYVGPATIEAWTVMCDRDNLPERAHAACRTPDGDRVWAVSNEPDLMSTLMVDDVHGTAVTIDSDHVMRFTD